MLSAHDIRARHRTVVIHPDGTAYAIRKLREIDFVDEQMMLMAARTDNPQEARALVERHVRDHADSVIEGLPITILTKGVVGIATRKGTNGAEDWDIAPLTVVRVPTDDPDKIYYLDLGPHFAWLSDQIQRFSGLGPEVAASQDKFPGDVRADAVPAGQDVRGETP